MSLKEVFLVAALTLTADFAVAAMDESDQFFLMGYGAYLNGYYGECADYFYRVVDLDYGEVSRAKLYMAYCQVKLGLTEGAAYFIEDVTSSQVKPKEREMLDRLKRNLKPAIEALNRTYVNFYPYGGGVSYSSGYSKLSGSFFGISGDVTHRSWKFSFLGERFGLALIAPFSSYIQYQVVFGVQKSFAASEIHLKGAYIFADMASQNGVWIASLGGSEFLNLGRSTRLFGDAYFSSYPNSTMGALVAVQLNAGLDQAIMRSEDLEVWVRGASETLYTAAPGSVDAATSFTRQTWYQRFWGELNFKASDFTWGGMIGYGNEAFGVRNDLSIIFSTFENHQFSAGGFLAYWFSHQVNVKGTYNFEQFLVGSQSYSSSTIYGMLTISL